MERTGAGARRPVAGPRTKVLFIGGYGRSGSTILDRALGTTDGFLSTGEPVHLWGWGLDRGLGCGCGAPVRECPFWLPVIRQTVGRMDPDSVERVLDAERRIDRWWYTPLIARRRTPEWLQERVRAYVAVLRKLYPAIAAGGGARVIVDSSIDSSHAWLLTRMTDTVDPYFLHLVRDSRAVAHSLTKRKWDPARKRTMPRAHPARTGMAWTAGNLLFASLQGKAWPFMRLRYEDFAVDPKATVEAILRFVGEDQAPLAVTEDGTVRLGNDHVIEGNPVRSLTGEVRIRLDDEWRDSMPRHHQLLVTGITRPLLVRYGYL